jgi:hypothetical protein
MPFHHAVSSVGLHDLFFLLGPTGEKNDQMS